MNKRKIIASLNNIANSLDNSGLYSEANTVTRVMKRVAQSLNLADPEFEKKSIIQGIPYNAISNVVREAAIFVVQALGHENIPHDVWYALAQMIDRGMSSSQFDFGVNDQKLQPAMQKAENTLNEFLKAELGPVPKNDEAYEFWKERSKLYRAAIVKVLMEQSKLYTETTFEQAANNTKDKYDINPLKETVTQLDTKEYNPGNKNPNE